MQVSPVFSKTAVTQAWPAGPQDAPATSAISVLLGRNLLVAGCVVLGLMVALAYLIVTPARYQAVAEVLIDSRVNPVAERDGSSAAPLEIAEVESQVELIGSSKIATSAFEALSPNLQAKLGEGQPSVFSRLAGGAADVVRKLCGSDPVARGMAGPAGGAMLCDAVGPPAPPLSAEDMARLRIDAIKRGLALRRIGASYVVEIAFSAQDPALAAAVANEVASAYIRDQVQSKSDFWRGASSWMQQRLADLGTQANSAAQISQEYKASNQIVDLGNRGLVNEQQLGELNTALLEARAKTVEAASKLDQARKVMSSGRGIVPDALSDGVVAKLREQVAQLASRAADLEARLGPNHDAVVKTKADLAGAESSLRAEVVRISQTLQSNYEVAAARQRSLEDTFQQMLDRSGVTSRARVRAKELDRTSEAYDKLYTGLLQRYTDAVNQQSFPIATAQIISPAAVPDAPAAPRRALTLIFGLIAGAGLGVAGAFARDATDQSLRGVVQVERLGVPCYAMLPVLESEPDFKRRQSALASASPLPPTIVGDKLKVEFLRHDPGSLFAQSVQSIKTRLVMAGVGQDAKVIGVTSARSGEGKSTIAANLALLFSRPDRRTLLIDADTYNPTLTRLLDVPSGPGLSDVLRGRSSFREAVVELSGSNLTVLTGGQVNLDGDMLGSRQMRDLLAEARQHFDQIIVDLPPVGEVVATREVTPYLDGTLLVTTWRKTRLGSLRETLRAFDFDGTRVFGIVVNKTAPNACDARHTYAAYQTRMRARASS